MARAGDAPPELVPATGIWTLPEGRRALTVNRLIGLERVNAFLYW